MICRPSFPFRTFKDLYGQQRLNMHATFARNALLPAVALTTSSALAAYYTVWNRQQSRQNINTPTSAADVLPTLLTLTQQPVPNWVEGQPLPPYSSQHDASRPVFTVEAKHTQSRGKLHRRSVSVVRDNYKLVHYTGYEQAPDVMELYDMDADSAESNNLADHKPAIVQQLFTEIENRLRDTNAI